MIDTYGGWQQAQVAPGDELLVSSGVSGQESVSVRLAADDANDLVAIPRKLTCTTSRFSSVK